MKKTPFIVAGIIIGVTGLTAAALFGCVLAQYWHYAADRQNAERQLSDIKSQSRDLSTKLSEEEKDGEERLVALQEKIGIQEATLATQAAHLHAYVTLTNKEHDASLSLKKLQDDMQSKSSELLSLDKQLAILNMEIASSNEVLKTTSKKVSTKLQELQQYTLATNALQKTRQSIALNKETLTGLEADIVRLNGKKEGLDASLQSTEKTLQEKQLACEKSSEKTTGLQAQISTLEKQKGMIEKDVQKMEGQKTKLEQSLSGLTASMDKAKQELPELNALIRETNNSYVQLTNRLARTRAEIDQVKQVGQAEAKQLKASAQAEVDAFRKEREAEAKQLKASAQAEVEVFRKQREAEALKLAELNANQTALTATIANLKKERKGLEDSIKELENAQDKLRASLAREETTLELAKKEVKEQQGLIERQTAILSDLNKKIEKKMAELEKAAKAL